MKQILSLCIKNMHFAYDNEVDQQNDGATRPVFDQ